MDRNTTVAFILISAILIIWLFLNSPQSSVPPGKTHDSTVVAKERPEKITGEVDKTTNVEKRTSDRKIGSDSLQYGSFFSAPKLTEKVITIENDLVKLEISTRGGNIKKYYLKTFKNWYAIDIDEEKNFYFENVQLLNFSKGGDYNLSFVTSDGKAINTGGLDFIFSGNKNHYQLSNDDSLQLSFLLKVGETKKISKSFTLKSTSEQSRACSAPSS